MDNSIIVAPKSVEVTKNALIFHNGISYEEWEQLGKSLDTVESGYQWWRGDWLNHGEFAYGEMYSQALDETQTNTWKHYKWVASRYERCTRVHLSWTHHREVAGIEDKKERARWLEMAIEKGWEARDFRQKIKEEKEKQLQTGLSEYKEGEQIQVKAGEWWRLDKHLLYCGDTSSQEFISKLPNVAFAFADPPYGAEAAEWDSKFYWKHDYLIDKAGVVAVTPGIVSIFEFANLTAMPYKWSVACWIDNGMTRGELGFGNWIYTALFTDKSLYHNAQDFIRVSINNADTDETDHKGRKPAGLVAYLMRLFTQENDYVIDPFLGSGTTLFVANEIGRSCIGGEINPEYCAEIITRWQTKTGQKAERV